jgi:hypothetical protein
MHINHNFYFTELEETIMSGLMLTFIPFKTFDLLCCRVEVGAAGAGATGARAASKFSPRAGAA